MIRLKIFQVIFMILFFASGCVRSLTFDAQGVAHGAGERTYNYKSGVIQLRENYVDGKLIRSRWFRPDGTLLHETKWINGSGESIYLREDGSVYKRMQYVNGVAEGETQEFNEAGNVIKTMLYHDGQRVSEKAVSPRG